ncbi:MAG: trypsin-like peptidase domain-containing protein [Chloroflexi bacterium]|nr:trypsin-like peptidase domain-containing protein [Chloroflexota bacterium]
MEEQRRHPKLSRWLATLAAVVMLLGLGAAGGALAAETLFGAASASPVLFDEAAVVSLYETASPAVVEVQVTEPPARVFRSLVPQSSQGSGFLVDAEGHILTNYHVVQGASRIRVTFSDGRVLDADVAGSSPADDVALLKVDPGKLSGIIPLSLGDSSTLKPGQMAIALGSPLGLENSITVGVVSGVNRNRPGIAGRTITGMVQTDASLNPGNSGGPLLNSRGEVIGINTSIDGSTISSGRIGFAVPINTAKDLLPQLKGGATVKRPWLGIAGRELTAELASSLGLGIPRGVVVVQVLPDSPAEAAGLEEAETDAAGQVTSVGDVITAVDGRIVSTVEDLIAYLNSRRPGTTVELTVVRDGQTLQVSVVLGEWPDSPGRR